jgi:VWA domain-containing protein
MTEVHMSPPDDGPRFTLAVDQNQYLPAGGDQLHAVLTVTATDPVGGVPADALAAEVIIVDCSASMSGGKLEEAKRAAETAVDVLRNGCYFAILAGNDVATRVYPPKPELVKASQVTRQRARAAIRRIRDAGGTAIGTWLRAAADLLRGYPEAARHAILLTDGQNTQSDADFARDLAHCTGAFVCDCLGVGEDWRPDQLKQIADALLGTRGYVQAAEDLSSQFAALTRQAMGKTVAEVALRVQVPQVAQVRFLKQVHPTHLDLTGRRVEAGPRTGDYPTGAWGAEERDYQLCVAFPAGSAGEEIRAAVVRLVVPDSGVELARSEVFASWTDDPRLSTRISPKVAHYTGQLELSTRVREGLQALESGDVATATARLAEARLLAEESGSTDTARLLDAVVDFDAGAGTVELRSRRIGRADLLALDVGTDRTSRMRPR